MAVTANQQEWQLPVPAPQDEARINGTLADSFPASDPPSWTPGVSRLPPERIADVTGRRRVGREIVAWTETGTLLLIIGFVVMLILGLPPLLFARLLGDAVSRLLSSLW